jgi:glutamyl-tRNA reductase
LEEELIETDILVVSTGSNLPTITPEHLKKDHPILILDLSMPENVDTSVKDIPGVTLINVDELSKITDKTIAVREKEIPKAKKIINTYKLEFNQWIEVRKYVPAVNALKESLHTIQNDVIDFQSKKLNNFNSEQAELVTSRVIQKITTQFVKHLKHEETAADVSIDVISKIFNINKSSFNEKN